MGAPDPEQALNVLPGHRLLLEGKGYEAVKLTITGSLMSLILTIAIIPLLGPLVPKVYNSVFNYIGWMLLAIAVFMVVREKQKVFWAFFVFTISGILGIIVLSMPNLNQPLFPLLSGIFGISTILMSLYDDVRIPKQNITNTIHIPKTQTIKALGAAVFSGSMIGIFPGLGAAQAAIIAKELVGKLEQYAFMILVGGINTVNFVFSLVTLYTLEKARNGAVIAIMEINKQVTIETLIIFLATALIAGGIATMLTFALTRVFCTLMGKINYKMLCIIIISFVTIMVAIFSGLPGILILIVSTAIGIIPVLKNVGRSHAMGCLLLPVILYFLL